MDCLKLSVIPQFGGSCWFNTILMICLYSQYTRKILIKECNKWDKTNSLLMIIKSILIKYYNQPLKVQKFFNKIKPEIILFKILKNNNEYDIINFIKKQMKKNISNIGWYETYIIKFLKYLNINCLDIIYSNGEYIFNFDNEIKTVYHKNIDLLNNNLKYTDDTIIYNEIKKIIKNIPDILIVIHEDLNILVNSEYIPLYNIRKSKYFSNKIYNCKIKGIDTYQDIIYFNGFKYILDATTLINYDIIDNNHAIAGITCNNERYVYNGWQYNTNDPAFIKSKSLNNESSPCSLMKYKWDLRYDNSFCLNPITCKLDFINKGDRYKNLCFSFGTKEKKARRFLIYVRDIEYKNNEKISIPEEIKVSNISKIIKDIHDIKKLSDNELILELNKFNIYLVNGIYYSRETLEGLYYDELKKYYNINSKEIIKQSKEKSIERKNKTKNELIIEILKKYPNMKNLKNKKKKELEIILYNENKEDNNTIKKKLNNIVDNLQDIIKII